MAEVVDVGEVAGARREPKQVPSLSDHRSLPGYVVFPAGRWTLRTFGSILRNMG